MSIQPFFNTRQMKTTLRRHIQNFESTAAISDFAKNRNLNLINIFEHFISEAEYWDERTQFNIRAIGNTFEHLTSSDDNTQNDLNFAFAISLRFIFEASLLEQSTSSSMPFKMMQDFAIHNIDKFDEESQKQIRYALYALPIDIVRVFIGNDEVKSYLQFIDALNKAKALQEHWITELDNKVKRVKELNDTLKKQESAFNFVGLYAGFAKLGRFKAKELRWSRFAMFALGALMPAPLTYEIINGGDLINSDASIGGLIKIIPIASITLILIYYFRVALGNYNSVRAQVMQIELRKSLCRFIQSYADYAKELPRENTALLSKFEDVIFSNIMISEEKTPSTFDGIEQLATLLSSIKGGKN
ncbi:hypothetical protein JMT66_03055 [Kosakonia cowanii]|uniref:hypothetical protein n=1 Tax=Kosakonia cowanii TaxID=208223 RepID=UPI001E5F6D72|nr:hypothetical protein [Kosakonia cowanii]UGS46689.1 hypothetical protein JMT66_03055 [Kosakonia cowanii]